MTGSTGTGAPFRPTETGEHRSERADHARPREAEPRDAAGALPAAGHGPRRPGLQPPAARAHHLPGLRGRGRQRQRHLRAAAAARCGRPRQGHLALHQLTGWIRVGRDGHLRHDAVGEERRGHGLDGHGRLDGTVPAVRRHAGQALCAAALADHDAPALGWARRHGVRHPDPGRADAVHQGQDGRAHRPAHRPDRRDHRARLGPGPLVHCRRGPRVRPRRRGRVERRPGGRVGRHGMTATSGPPARGERALMSDLYPPSSRYVLPQMEERTSYGFKRMDPYNKLFEERIIFLGTQIDDVSANDVMAQLLTLESMDPDRDISIYINSPGGSFTALTAIYDTMQFVRPDIQTTCLGQAASAAAIILAAGTPGKRFALANSRILIHQPSTEGGGQASDVEIQARELLRRRELLEKMLAEHSNRTAEQVQADIERDKILTAEEAVEYGLVDRVLTTRAG